MLGYNLDIIPVATLDPGGRTISFHVQCRAPITTSGKRPEGSAPFPNKVPKEYPSILWHNAVYAKELVVPHVGDIVLVHDKGPMLLWSLCRVVELHVSKLKTLGETVSRPVSLLCPEVPSRAVGSIRNCAATDTGDRLTLFQQL